MRARGMTHNQHLIGVTGQGGSDLVAELRHARLQLRRIGPAPFGGEGVIMHQVIGEEFTVVEAKPLQRRDGGQDA